MRTRLLTVFLALATLLPAAPSASEERPPKPAKRSEVQAPGESDRDAKIRKAREEISRNPAQKPFILFRYGIREEDLQASPSR